MLGKPVAPFHRNVCDISDVFKCGYEVDERIAPVSVYFQLTELNTFFLKHFLRFPAKHPFCWGRILLIGLISAPTVRLVFSSCLKSNCQLFNKLLRKLADTSGAEVFRRPSEGCRYSERVVLPTVSALAGVALSKVSDAWTDWFLCLQTILCLFDWHKMQAIRNADVGLHVSFVIRFFRFFKMSFVFVTT